MTAAAWPSQRPRLLCGTCELLMAGPVDGDTLSVVVKCPRCGARVHRRKPDSISRTWAFLIAATLCYVPANVYPVMEVTSLGNKQADTILSGALFLFEHGLWPLALIIFVASVFVPILKIGLIGFLAVSVQRRSQWRPKERARIYRMVETIGRWSMVDVFVVTILVALVHLGAVAQVEARLGALFFGAVVVLTMLAAEAFDPRLIWDVIEEADDRRPG